MTGRFAYRPLAKYPHMKPEDIAVWERYLHQNPDAFDTVDYDVPCGVGAPVDPSHPPEIQADHTILTQKKIDVVGYKDNGVYVIEVGPIADARKLGQILTYLHLFSADHPEYSTVVPMVICREVEREMDALYASHGIVVHTA